MAVANAVSSEHVFIQWKSTDGSSPLLYNCRCPLWPLMASKGSRATLEGTSALIGHRAENLPHSPSPDECELVHCHVFTGICHSCVRTLFLSNGGYSCTLWISLYFAFTFTSWLKSGYYAGLLTTGLIILFPLCNGELKRICNIFSIKMAKKKYIIYLSYMLLSCVHHPRFFQKCSNPIINQ